jgi:peptide/nickel transport system permease protein
VVLHRFAYSVLALVGVVTIVFLLLHLSGDPLALLLPLDTTTPQDVARFRHAYGLDRPLSVQYLLYLSRVARGDLGFSYRYGQPVSTLLRERVQATLTLALFAMSVSIVLGVTLGVVAGVRRGTAADAMAMFVSLVGISVPSFWLGLIFIVVFGVLLGWLPVSGYGGLQHLLMPGIVLGSVYAAQVSRLTRTSLLEVLAQDYVRTARAKGLAESVVIVKHALRNAGLTVLTVLGLSFGRMLGGAVVVETIFSWPGMGRLAVQAVLARDFPVVQGTVIVGAAIFLGANLAVDLLCGWLDPRLRDVA